MNKRILKKFIISFDLNGFKYLKESVKLVLKNYNLIYKINTCIYPMLAKKYNTTNINIERNIRYIIRANYNKVNKAFNLLNYPSNAELIAELVEFIRLNI